jgi:predicted transcriptional regulator of viral defense system
MADEGAIDRDIRRELHSRGVEAAIAVLADRQHGVVTRAQLVAMGLGTDAIDWRVRRGRLHVLHRGVYAVGHRRLTRRGHWMAAVLAAGPGAVLSHRPAAALWDLRASERSRPVVSTPRWCCRPGIAVHRARLEPDEITEVDGIPVTTVARTLLDLAAVLPRPQLERATERAEALRLTNVVPIDALLERHRGHRGTAALREIVKGRMQATLTRSELEDRFLTFLDAYGLARPEVNADLNLDGRWFEVDFLWRDQHLIVELDGHQTHGTRAAFERDRERDRILQVHGWRIVRITWRQLHDTPDAVAADLARLLG